MSRGKASGISLTNRDATIVLGMAIRGDRDHDIAAWFGVNQGRIAEVKSGSHGPLTAAAAHELPPKGPPGLKGRRLRMSSAKTVELMKEGNLKEALEVLTEALKKYDTNEA
jgi:hypothetical protein